MISLENSTKHLKKIVLFLVSCRKYRGRKQFLNLFYKIFRIAKEKHNKTKQKETPYFYIAVSIMAETHNPFCNILYKIQRKRVT